MEEVYFDADGCVAGRLASLAAKELLKGRKVAIVNAEKAVIAGNPQHTIGLFREKAGRGDPYHGPFYPRVPDRMLRRMVRGMLPRRTPRGREAFRNLRVYISVPEGLKGMEFRPAKKIQPEAKSISLGLLSRRLK